MLALELQQSHFAADRTPIQIARSNIFSWHYVQAS